MSARTPTTLPRRAALAGLAALSLAAIGLATGLTATPAKAQDGPGVTATEIKLGAWMPLTGPVAIIGVPQRAGSDAYFNLLNSQGGIKGRKISYLVEDNAYNPQRTVAAARKLISSDNVLAIVSPNGTAQSSAAMPYVLDEEKVPLLNPYAGAMDWYYPPRANMYGVQIPFERHAFALGRMADQDGAGKVLVMYSALPAFENVAINVEPGVKAGAAGKSIPVELLPVKFGTQDFAPIALDIIKRKPTSIIYFAVLSEIANLIKELKKQGFSAQNYSYGPTAQMTLIDLGGDAVDGIKVTSITVPPDADTPAVREYREALAKVAPNEKPDFASLTAYAQVKIVAEAIRRVNGPLNRQTLVAAMETLKDYETGIYPPVTYSATEHMGSNKFYPVQLKAGKWVSLGPAIPVGQ